MKIKLLTTSLLLAGALSVSAGKFDQPQATTFEAVNPNAPIVNRSTPNSSVTINFGFLTGESWDGQDDASNVFANCVTGGSVTGFEWNNVAIDTVGASFLSEASLLFTDTAGTNGIRLRVGSADANAGSGVYSSGGILDLTDASLPDIVPGADGKILLQIHETFDDVADTIDANFTGGTLIVHGIDLASDPACIFKAPPPAIVPANNWFALFALILTLGFFGRKYIKE